MGLCLGTSKTQHVVFDKGRELQQLSACSLGSAGTGSCSGVGVVGEGWGACPGLPGTRGPVCSLHCCPVNHPMPLGHHTGQRDFCLVSPSFCLWVCTEQEAWCFGRTWRPAKMKVRETTGAANRLQQEEKGRLKYRVVFPLISGQAGSNPYKPKARNRKCHAKYSEANCGSESSQAICVQEGNRALSYYGWWLTITAC